MTEETNNKPTVKPAIVSLREDLASRLIEVAPSVKDTVINELVSKEIERRKNIILTALDRDSQLNKDLSKIKPDCQLFDRAGIMVSESFTKQANEQRANLEKNITKLNNLIEQAMTKNEWKPLEDLLSSAKTGSDNKGQSGQSNTGNS